MINPNQLADAGFQVCPVPYVRPEIYKFYKLVFGQYGASSGRLLAERCPPAASAQAHALSQIVSKVCGVTVRPYHVEFSVVGPAPDRFHRAKPTGYDVWIPLYHTYVQILSHSQHAADIDFAGYGLEDTPSDRTIYCETRYAQLLEAGCVARIVSVAAGTCMIWDQRSWAQPHTCGSIGLLYRYASNGSTLYDIIKSRARPIPWMV